ncbi:nitroreductase [Acinetobacter rathckeae]|uniref:nitroreductase n=1 Tax=Acinetobacter rathckeae TaxID=2605272 RepID=UPI0018A27057|nr:nitroreductase [Acinetobacter rathckeae]MBF7688567.1 nitroreductase [Acinetobacter rathckeae]MBF7695814.1 nitroreductase [Acinetobacter rathckeae]
MTTSPDHISTDMLTQAIDQTITSRHAIRAFLKDREVSRTTIENILTVASYAPSGTNTQPWKVYVVSGKTRERIVKRVCEAQANINNSKADASEYQESFKYYPEQWVSPYIDRRRQNGWALYGLLNIQRGEKEKMAAQHMRNFQFFDAPVGLFFTVDHVMGIGAKMDIAMMMQNVMLASKARGLDTCPQAAWNHFHHIVLEELNAPANETLVCGMALGYADPDAVVNQLQTPRESVATFSQFLD